MSLLSPQFILLSFATALFVWSTRGSVRTLGFLAASGYFASTYLTKPGMASTLLFCGAGFLCAQLVRKRPGMLWMAVAGLTVAFMYARNYTFLGLFVSDDLRTDIFRSAGLSFLFFKIIHVTIDSAGGTLQRLPLLSYFAYCINFTAFLLGPIQRYQDFESQWEGRTEAVPARFEAYLDAVNRLLRGMVKKYVVAEYLVAFALQANAPVDTMSAVDLVLQTYTFYIFLYFDFSGYCDIVIGVGTLLGVKPPENFNLPFLAPNITQFWLRVHRSLTLWLTDYVFNPAYAGALRSKSLGSHPLVAAVAAVMLTMFVSGLWHGTTTSFVLFGMAHGAYLAGFRVFEHVAVNSMGRKGLRKLRANPLWRVGSTVLTFNLTAATYLFFVLDAEQLLRILQRLYL